MLSPNRTRLGIASLMAALATLALPTLATASPLGTVTNFSTGLQGTNGSDSFATAITPGPDGNMWFSDQGGSFSSGSNAIGRIKLDGTINEFSTGLQGSPNGSNSLITSIVAGPDGNLWFADAGFFAGGAGAIGRAEPDGTIQEFSAGLSATSIPTAIVPGSDGNMWFADRGLGNGTSAAVGKITPSGSITEFPAAKATGNLAGPAIAKGDFSFASGKGNTTGGSTTITSPATGTGDLTNGSPEITSLNPTSGAFAVGEKIISGGGELPAGTEISACSPDCSAPTSLTLSNNATASATGASLTVLVVTDGTFVVGQTISDGQGNLPANTTVTACTPDCSAPTSLTISNPATATSATPDVLAAGSTTVSNVIVKNGAFIVGQTLDSGGPIQNGTTITACAPDCVSPTSLTLSQIPAQNGTQSFSASATNTVSNLNPTSGTFAVGASISGLGIPAGTTITACDPDCSTPTSLTLSTSATQSGEGVSVSGGLSSKSVPLKATSGPDGNMWFTDVAQRNEQQAISVMGSPTGGTFTLFFNGDATAGIPYNATASEVRNALGALSSIGAPGNIEVQQSGATYTVEFMGLDLRRRDVPLIGVDYSGLTGGTNPVVLVAATVEGIANSVGRVTPSGVVTEFPLPGEVPGGTFPFQGSGITAGPEGDVWFMAAGKIDRISSSGDITRFGITDLSTGSTLVTGPDGDLWFTALSGSIYSMSPSGIVNTYNTAPGVEGRSLAVGSDGSLWAGGATAISRFSLGSLGPPASLRAPSVDGTATVGSPQACADDRWATWAGQQPFYGGLLDSSTSPVAYQWYLDDSAHPISGANSRSYTPLAGDQTHQIFCKVTVSYRLPLNVTASATSQPVTVGALLQGPPGTPGQNGSDGAPGADGATGPAGPQGASGTQGQQGLQGPQGTKGDQGPQGLRGPAGKVTCKVKGKAPKVKVICTVKTPLRAHLRWSLRRDGHTYRHGTTSGRRLRLHLGRLDKGRYLLYVEGRGDTVIVVN